MSRYKCVSSAMIKMINGRPANTSEPRQLGSRCWWQPSDLSISSEQTKQSLQSWETDSTPMYSWIKHEDKVMHRNPWPTYIHYMLHISEWQGCKATRYNSLSLLIHSTQWHVKVINCHISASATLWHYRFARVSKAVSKVLSRAMWAHRATLISVSTTCQSTTQ